MAAGKNAGGRLEVFGRGNDKTLVHIYQTSPGGTWSNWAGLGGELQLVPSLGRNADGRLEVFAVAVDNAIWHIWQVAPNDGWSAWASLGGDVGSSPLVYSNADGRFELFALTRDTALWHIGQAYHQGSGALGSLWGAPSERSMECPLLMCVATSMDDLNYLQSRQTTRCGISRKCLPVEIGHLGTLWVEI
jgi:hypothetical protein